ncbi:hypothetical protein CHGG_10506 [Chaetomium globosum CBS 148.51]|uniref:Putative lipoate-protein ligase A n=1 Tax=Chaetomium globosum (strain ATCC 6205 / CBS 148.51 / DSM 1962 / NBRC 6347 / NRRL 1970) TaxID=306901 RepID=Q2GNE8_CHAGB|nr:uncharacterized protein CHGG_10506 [Chaetomium globosum CBS 148.51]EAQ84102.1 hypothetical protein CHGG_10506 [Chaetomium globosum CBS 148.51]
MALPVRLGAIPRHFSISPLKHPNKTLHPKPHPPPPDLPLRLHRPLPQPLYRAPPPPALPPGLNHPLPLHQPPQHHHRPQPKPLARSQPSRPPRGAYPPNPHHQPPDPNTTATATSTNDDYPNPQTATPIALVRRRSGGGTVFHDAGNTNYSVICPPAVFDRDRHAEMVVRALRGLGVGGARVNERHDIVVDVSGSDDGGGGGGGGGTFKVSGSAYKLTRTRSLHHGTCLLGSENLGRVSRLLRSPAEGFVKARGVESVRSPIRNVGVGGEVFVDAVMGEFRKMYGDAAGQGVVVGEDEALANEEVVKGGAGSLVSPDWIFEQTPAVYLLEASGPRKIPGSGRRWRIRCPMDIRHGEIQSATMAGLEYHDFVDEASQDEILSKAVVKQRLHYITDWRRTLQQASPIPVDVDDAGEFLNHMFGIQPPAENGGGAVAQTVVQTISDTVVGMFLDGDIIDL